MISAERMKSVRMAPPTSSSSRAGPCAGRRRLRVVVRADRFPELLGPLVAEVGAAEHQEGSQQPRQELAEQQRRREDEEQLVSQ
jgi:hypothetical protein